MAVRAGVWISFFKAGKRVEMLCRKLKGSLFRLRGCYLITVVVDWRVNGERRQRNVKFKNISREIQNQVDSSWLSQKPLDGEKFRDLIWLLAVRILVSRMETLIFHFTNNLIRICNFLCFHLRPQVRIWWKNNFLSSENARVTTEQTLPVDFSRRRVEKARSPVAGGDGR